MTTRYTFKAPIKDVDDDKFILFINLGNACEMQLQVSKEECDYIVRGDLVSITVEIPCLV